MEITNGAIISNLIDYEPVVVQSFKKMGSMYAIKYIGKNSNRSNSKMVDYDQLNQLKVLTEEGKFNFSGDPSNFMLFAEAERINSAYQFDPLFAVNCSIVDPLPHQVEAVYKFLLPLPKIRFLLADDTGAGKTIMTGLLIKELMMRGVVERILIVTPGGLTKQWQEDEMGVKFSIPFTLVNRASFTADPNIFRSSSRVVTSIDFISREDILNVIGGTHWDLVVFDECHKLSAYDYGFKKYESLRYRSAQLLSQQCEHLLLLTATPHRGRKDTFKKLLQLLDEDIFATEDIASERIREVEKNGANRFFIRRLKEDMKDWEGNPLFKKRSTKTIAYEITPAEKKLYNAVTSYLTEKKEEASQTRNIHVSLALTVMQRRLVSSIFAIRNTLEKRFHALQGIVDELSRSPNLWKQRHKIEGFDIDDIDDFEDLEDDERDALENILSDPKKFKLFTTATSVAEIQKEAGEVRKLLNMANELYNSGQEEQKFKELQQLLKSNGVLDKGEKLVIFTEHKDTLMYLEDRLTKSGGYKVATIHGGKNVDERREAQRAFYGEDTQILIATDAAGEGINLQFCRLLINWDIPWNPNRLEQRMGRIHRYGQKSDVIVFNMVANNTKEGKVLEKLLTKMDIIRESMGDDRVYDVIQDVLENVKLDEIMEAVFNGEENSFVDFINQDTEQMKINFQNKIDEQKVELTNSGINFRDARNLKESSDEKRLQPIYIRLFFEKAFKHIGGDFTETKPNIFKITNVPDAIATYVREKYNISSQSIEQAQFCFDKKVFLDYQIAGIHGALHYINPGNPIFDALVEIVRNAFREDVLKGTVLVSPIDKDPYFAFFVKSQIADNRPSKMDDNIVDERLLMVNHFMDDRFEMTSSAKFIDLKEPAIFSKPIDTPEVVDQAIVQGWSFDNITMDQFQDTKDRIEEDLQRRKEYLQTSFTNLIMDIQNDINALQGKLLMGNDKVSEALTKKETKHKELIVKRKERLEKLDSMAQLSPKEPEILGCAYVVPLTQVEYEANFGMKRDDEAEKIAMETAMQYEIEQGWMPQDVSANNEGYDIRSTNPAQLKRYIEVKGRSGDRGDVMVSENEMNRLAQLGDSAWLYIVINCKTTPQLFCIQNPAQNLIFDQKTKGIQYFLKMEEWKKKI